MSERLKSNTSENSDWLEQWNKIADDERIDKFKEKKYTLFISILSIFTQKI